MAQHMDYLPVFIVYLLITSGTTNSQVCTHLNHGCKCIKYLGFITVGYMCSPRAMAANIPICRIIIFISACKQRSGFSLCELRGVATWVERLDRCFVLYTWRVLCTVHVCIRHSSRHFQTQGNQQQFSTSSAHRVMVKMPSMVHQQYARPFTI